MKNQQQKDASKAAAAQIIPGVKARVADLERTQSALQNVMLGHGFVVMCGDLYLDFDVVNSIASNPRVCRPEKCVRFSREDAERVAREVRNGNGDRGAVIHIRDAIERALSENVELLKICESTLAE